MSRLRQSLVALGLICLSGTALAMAPHKAMPFTGQACPMMRPMMRPHGPHPLVPMLLPLAEMRSYALHLNDHQVSALAVWQNRHMRMAVPLIKRLRADKSALRAGIMEGAHRGVLRDIMRRLNSDRARMLGLKVAQVRMVHKTLSLGQWRKLLVLYRRMHAFAMGGSYR